MLVAAVVCAPAAAAASPLRVLVVASERDDELLARVEGQVADLDVTLVRAASAMAPAPLAPQLDRARTLARQHQAGAVVWFERDGEDVIVHVADPDARRVLVRRVDAGPGAMSGSATSEAAAVIVRGVLRGLVAGGEIDVAAPAPAAGTGRDRAADAGAPPGAVDGSATPAARAGAGLGGVRPLRPVAAVSWSGILDGEAPAGHHGVAARLGVAGGPWHAAITLTHRPAIELRGAMATIAIERQELGLALGLDVVGGARRHPRGAARWRTGVEVALAMTRFGRATTATGADLAPTADRATWTPAATPAVRAARHLGRGAWLELALGVDLLALPPEFGVAAGGTFTTVARPWPVEPRLGLGVVVDPF